MAANPWMELDGTLQNLSFAEIIHHDAFVFGLTIKVYGEVFDVTVTGAFPFV